MSDALEAAAGRLLPLIDLTSLNDAHDDDVAGLCAKAVTPAGPVAAVCTWPEHLEEAKRRLEGSGVRLVSVLNFPNGGADTAAVLAEIPPALAAGAGELDLVMPYRAWLAGERRAARALIGEVKAALGSRARLKVILESGELGPPEQVAAAAADAIEAGADFIKTSTGKTGSGATLAAAEAMLGAIRAAGRGVGFKAAGGIRTTAAAKQYLDLTEGMMGPGWIGPGSFRIGASGLLDELLAVLGQGPRRSDSSGY
jgi:deoxyribose-phosphate aldolase